MEIMARICAVRSAVMTIGAAVYIAGTSPSTTAYVGTCIYSHLLPSDSSDLARARLGSAHVVHGLVLVLRVAVEVARDLLETDSLRRTTS